MLIGTRAAAADTRSLTRPQFPIRGLDGLSAVSASDVAQEPRRNFENEPNTVVSNPEFMSGTRHRASVYTEHNRPSVALSHRERGLDIRTEMHELVSTWEQSRLEDRVQ